MTGRPEVVLGFDYGRLHIGVAVGQSVTASAQPLETVAGNGHRPDWEAISRLIHTWQPTRLVVGLPLNMDGSEQEMSHAARRFGRQLTGRYALPVDLVDERLSTREAGSQVWKARGRLAALDPVAAKLILESWLAEHSRR
jgi:putative Holliday junction resolvase